MGNPQKMHVALEVSTVGLGQTNKQEGYNRTGIYRVTSGLSKALLREKDVDVSVFFWEFPYTLDPGVQYYRRYGHKVKTVLANSSLESVIYNAIYGMTNSPLRFDILRVLSRILRGVGTKSMAKSIDVVHSLYYPNPEFVDPRKTVRFRTIHDIIPILFPRFFTEKHRRSFVKNIRKSCVEQDWFFCGSQATKDDLCNYLGVSEERVFVNYFGAAPDIYHQETEEARIVHVRNKLSIPGGEYFLSVGTIEPRKNIGRVIKCFKKVLSTPGIGKEYSLVLVGRHGWLVDDLLREVASDSLLREKVIITGFVPDKWLSPLFSGSFAFLFPSLYEGFGLPVLEAMQCGVPVITSNCSSLPEVVGDAGIQVDPSNEDDLCQAIIDIINGEELRADLSRKGLERAKLFSWDKCAEGTIEGYRYAIDHT